MKMLKSYLPTGTSLKLGESECKFLINKSNYKDTIIRHFAGGQHWRKEWFEKETPNRLKIINVKLFIKSYIPKIKPKTLKKFKSFLKKFLNI